MLESELQQAAYSHFCSNLSSADKGFSRHVKDRKASALHNPIDTRQVCRGIVKESTSSLVLQNAACLSRMVVGQTLQIIGPTDENARDKYQWYQVDSRGDWFPISGATRNQVRFG